MVIRCDSSWIQLSAFGSCRVRPEVAVPACAAGTERRASR